MLLDDIHCDELLIGDVDQMWAAWETEFMSVMHQCIPTENLSTKSNGTIDIRSICVHCLPLIITILIPLSPSPSPSPANECPNHYLFTEDEVLEIHASVIGYNKF